MQPEEVEEGIFSSPLDLEEERRKYEASAILYRAIKYIIGYLKGYRIEKQENLTSNPAWIFVKVYWKSEDIEKDIKEIEEEIRRLERENWKKAYGHEPEEIRKEIREENKID